MQPTVVLEILDVVVFKVTPLKCYLVILILVPSVMMVVVGVADPRLGCAGVRKEHLVVGVASETSSSHTFYVSLFPEEHRCDHTDCD